MTVADLFAGPGGWELAAQTLGVDTIGFEVDPEVCATRAAAGWPTIRTDLNNYPPAAELTGLIGSPPCPAFSEAGLGHGRSDIDRLTRQVVDGDTNVSGIWHHRDSALMLAPLRWIQAGRPRWITLEQVPPALPVWHAYRHRLELDGYSAWTGILNAADYGTPQTRRRAILIASLDARVARPPSTHTREPADTLFDPLEPWASAGDALTSSGLWPPGTSAAINTGRYWRPGGTRDDAQTVGSDRPAPSLTAKSGGQWHLGFDRLDDLDGPTDYRERDRRPDTSPAHTITHKARSATWLRGRPATTVTGDSRLWPPGHKLNGRDIARLGDTAARERYAGRAGVDAIRLTEPEGLVLQGLPVDYPIVGRSQTARWRQIGNAIPPPLARAALLEVTR